MLFLSNITFEKTLVACVLKSGAFVDRAIIQSSLLRLSLPP
jgi:hypothetical protein